MLNSRQKKIIADLSNIKTLITANNLADRYNVSLRTIRNDINEIAIFLAQKDIELLRIPGQGMRIIDSKKADNLFDNSFELQSFPYLEKTERTYLLFLRLVFNKGPVSGNLLSEEFEVSKGTILNTIDDTNAEIDKYRLKICSYQNKGYHLEGKTKNVVRACEEIIKNNGEELIYNTLLNKNNHFIDDELEEKINEMLHFISNDLLLYITHHYYLGFMLYLIIFRSEGNYRLSSDSSDDKLGRLFSYIEQQFDISINKEGQNIIRHILNYATDYSNTAETDTNLSEAIDAMITYINSSGLYQINDYDNLYRDLLVHLKSTISAIASKMPRENPLLDEIKSSYPQEFSLVKSAVQRFHEIYPLKLDDNEIGYITLYFLRSFDKAEKIQDTNVMVVCNTGVAASKLLATRLINNIPDIHVVSMSSLYNIQNNPSALDNVDFVISTIPLTNLKKPHVVVSPLLQKEEINKVKEAIWISKTDFEKENDNNEYLINDPTKKENNFLSNNNIFSADSALLLGETAMSLFELIQELYPKGITEEDYGKVSGIFAHVLMSIPRWQRAEFIEPSDYENLKNSYAKQCDIIKKYLVTMSKKIGIMIPDVEIIAILRYYIY